MTSPSTLKLIKQLSDETFVTLGGYSEVSLYMPINSLIKSVFFPGQTLFMSNLITNPDDIISFDLQPFGYIPNTYLTVLSENFDVLYKRIIPPTTIQGKTIYVFATNSIEQNLIYKSHCTRLLFNFLSYNSSNTIQVIGVTKATPSIYSSVLNSYRNIKLTSTPTINTDEIFVDFSYPTIHLFSCPISHPFTTLFSPKNQTTTNSQIYISTSTSITFCLCSISYSPYTPLIGLTHTQLSSLLSPTHQKIYFDNVSQSHYWLSNDLSHRLSISFSGSTVYSSTKESFTPLPLTIIKSSGDISRLISKNNVYTLKLYSNLHPRLNLFCKA